MKILKDLLQKITQQKCFYSSLKDRPTGNNGKKLNGHVSDKDYLTCNKIWNEFKMKIWVIITIII